MKIRVILQKLIPSKQILSHTKKRKHHEGYISPKKLRKSIKECSLHLSNNIKRFTRRRQRQRQSEKRNKD